MSIDREPHRNLYDPGPTVFSAGCNLCNSQGSKKGDRSFIHLTKQDTNSSPSGSFRTNRRGADSWETKGINWHFRRVAAFSNRLRKRNARFSGRK